MGLLKGPRFAPKAGVGFAAALLVNSKWEKNTLTLRPKSWGGGKEKFKSKEKQLLNGSRFVPKAGVGFVVAAGAAVPNAGIPVNVTMQRQVRKGKFF